MLKISELTTDNAAIHWDEYVNHSPCSTPYHLSGWRRVVEKTFGHKPYYILAEDEEKIVGVLPCFLIKRPVSGCSLISLPFTAYAGILADNPEIEQKLLDEMKQLTRRLNADCLELRNITMANDPGLCLKDIYVTFIMEIVGDMWKKLPSKHRNMIRKAMKSSLTVDTSREYLKDFYRLFNCRMHELGTPVYSPRFFQNILEEFSCATILVIKKQTEVIAAGLLIPFKDTLYNPWTASNKDFVSLAPNNLFYWECIRYCQENGLHHFDIGRSIWNSGTFNFKSHIGATPKQLYYQYHLNGIKDMPGIDANNPRYEMCIKMWQRLPLWLTRILGPGVIRYVP